MDLNYYLDHGIITLDDVAACGLEGAMNRILKKVHPYAISKAGGFYCTRIKDDYMPDGRRKIKRKSRYALEKWLLEYYQIEETISFNSIYREFMKYHMRTKKPSTRAAYVKAYNKYYKGDPFMDRELSGIKVPELKTWLLDKIAEYDMNFKSYSKFAVVFKQLFQYAMEMDYVQRNPFSQITCRSLGLRRPKVKETSKAVFTKDETKDIFKAAFEDLANRPSCVPFAVMLIFLTGMRLGECVALKWTDIDFEKKLLHVQRIEEKVPDCDESYTKLSNYHYEIYENEVKGGVEGFGPRTVILTDNAIYLLNLLKDYYKDVGIHSEWLFVSKRYGKMHERAVDMKIRKLCGDIGTVTKSTHKIRATYISLLASENVSWARIAKQVGHKQVTTTMNYYFHDVRSEEENRIIIEKSLQFFEGPKGTQNQ